MKFIENKRFPGLNVHGDLYARGELQRLESLDGLFVGADNVDKALVSSELELLAGILILVNRSQDSYDLLVCGKRNGTRYSRAAALCRLDDLLGSRVYDAVFVTPLP